MYIADYDGVAAYKEQCLHIIDAHKNIIIFGASRTGERVYDLIKLGGGY